ncbi:type IV secretory system conjugative DNA transfer family protein [Antrihabitans spumae]|uniref:Type IV secretory system conjugative DNA transfer family protein n=1 Tax=Antrihabitans spumae TaxID=3373370 RepID=A0ABW7KJ84_9NOCA
MTGLRRLGDTRANALRREIPEMRGRLVAELPGSALELRVDTDHDGVVRTLVLVDAGSDTELLAAEVTAVLEGIADVRSIGAATGNERMEWPIQVIREECTLGYEIPGSSVLKKVPLDVSDRRRAVWLGRPAVVDWVGPHPGHGVRIRLWASKGIERDGCIATWTVVTDGQSPSLRLRAWLRSLLPGLVIATNPGGAPNKLEVGSEQLGLALPVPVVGSDPVTGVRLGAAAPIPMNPSALSDSDETAVRIGVGRTPGGSRWPLRLSETERLRHLHVFGRTGTGKSTFLAGIVNEIATGSEGMLVLDPHGHLIDRIIAELPESARGRTWVIRSGDVEAPVPLNPMAVEDPDRREIAIEAMCGMFQYLFDRTNTGIVGPRFRERLGMALRALAAVHGGNASVLDVPLALADDKFMRAAVNASGDERLKKWFENDVVNRRSNEYGDLVSWVNSKFEAFTATAAMRAILGSGADAFDMAEAMDSGRIILVDLSKSSLGEQSARLLGYLHLHRLWEATLRRSTARAFTVVVDEVHSVISGSLTAMLSEGRKFGLSVIMANQYLGQLDDDLRPAVDGNVATTVSFRCAAQDAAAMYRRLGGNIDTSTLMALPDLTAIIQRTAAPGSGEPYTMSVDHNARTTPRIAADLTDFHAALEESTNRGLVEPHRKHTERARAGKSNLSLPIADNPATPPRPSVTSERRLASLRNGRRSSMSGSRNVKQCRPNRGNRSNRRRVRHPLLMRNRRRGPAVREVILQCSVAVLASESAPAERLKAVGGPERS